MPKIEPIKEETYIVMGLSRSGTSMLAALLHILGVHMNPDRKPSVANPKGAFEDVNFIQIINDLSGGLLGPDHLNAKIKKLRRDERRMGKKWGFKSGMVYKALGSVLHLLANPRFVFVFRNPWHLAQAQARHTSWKGLGIPLSAEGRLPVILRNTTALADCMEIHSKVPSFVTTYEDLHRDASEEARRLAEFVGVEYTDTMRAEVLATIIPGYSSWAAMEEDIKRRSEG